MREPLVGCVVGLIGISAFSIALAFIARTGWRLNTWCLLLSAAGAGLMAVGTRIWLEWFCRVHGDHHVPTRWGVLILSGLLAAFLLYVLLQGLAR